MQYNFGADCLSENDIGGGAAAIKLTAAATTSPVSLEELKGHCRIDSDDEKGSLQTYLDAASEFVAERTSLILQPCTYAIELNGWWSGRLSVPLVPVRDVSVRYIDPLGNEHETADADFWWCRTPEGMAVALAGAFVRPAVLPGQTSVKVEVEAGFDADVTGSGDDPELVLPVRIKQAIMLLAGSWYANREAVSESDMKIVPLAVEALLAQLRIYR